MLDKTRDDLTVALLTYDAGEEMGRLRSSDPALRAYIGSRRRSDDDGGETPGR